jgi:hypothetical protein
MESSAEVSLNIAVRVAVTQGKKYKIQNPRK